MLAAQTILQIPSHSSGSEAQVLGTTQTPASARRGRSRKQAPKTQGPVPPPFPPLPPGGSLRMKRLEEALMC